MSLTVSPVTDAIYTDVKTFIMSVLPLDNAHVVKGQGNRVASPLGGTVASGGGYATMQIVNSPRLATNVDTWDPTDPAPTSQTTQMSTQVEVQVDLYSALAFDWANLFQAMWRDDYACELLTNCQPLYADNPILGDFTDSEDQYEQHFIIRAMLQYNPTVSTPQQFADTVSVSPIFNVDVEYPVT
jgi:hypothetical protein